MDWKRRFSLGKHRKWALLLIASAAYLTGGFAYAWEKGRLTIWLNEDRGPLGYRQIAEEYTKKTGIPVRVEVKQDLPGEFQKAAQSDEAPDIIVWAHDRIGEWVSLGLLRPIDPPSELRAELISLGWEAFKVQRKTYGYPLAIEAIGLIYNKKLVSQPPRTFEELPALDEQLKSKGVKAILWPYTIPYFTFPLMAANDAYPFYHDPLVGWDVKDTGINKSGAILGLQMLLQLIEKKVLPPEGKYDDPEEAMRSGKVAMIISGPWAWEKLRKAKIEIGVAPLPSVKGAAAKPFIGVQGLMIYGKTANFREATDFIENYVLKIENLRKINASRPIGMPAHRKFFRELYAEDVIRSAMIENIYAGRLMPSVPEMGKFWSALNTALIEVTSGQKRPKEALDQAALAVMGKSKNNKKTGS